MVNVRSIDPPPSGAEAQLAAPSKRIGVTMAARKTTVKFTSVLSVPVTMDTWARMLG